MYKIIQGILLLACLSIISCKHSDNPERQKAFDEVMEIHDEVMPEISTINKLTRQLKGKIDMMANPDSIQIMKTALSDLEKSEEGMMDWMHELDVPGKKIEDAAAIVYLNKEKIKIRKVSVDMKKSIANGKLILGLKK